MTVLPTYVGAGALATATGTTAATPAWPTHQAGDLGIMFVESANQAVATPAGWAPVGAGGVGVGTAAGAAATRLTAFYQFARTSSEPAGSVALSASGDHIGARIAVFRGVHQGNPINAVAASQTTTTQTTAVSFPAVTTTVANCLVVLGVSMELTETIGAVTNANLASITEHFDNSHTTGNDGAIAVITGTRAATGNIGTSSATLNATSVQERITIALRPKDDLDTRVLGNGWNANVDDGSATNSQTVTISAGTNRRLFVAVGYEFSAEPIATISSVTCGGNALTLVSDGVNSAAQQTQIGMVAWYSLPEASMPANGSQTLTVTLSGARQTYVAWMLLNGVEQGNVLDVTNTGETTTATNITAAMSFTGNNAFVLSASYFNGTNPQEFVTATVGGTAAPVVMDWFVTGGGHVSTFCFGPTSTDNPSVVHTGTSNARRALSAIAVGEPAAGNDVTAAVTTSSAAVTGDVVVANHFQRLGFTSGANTLSVTVESDADILIVGCNRNAATGAGATATYGGVAMQVANNSNDWAQLFYMLNPPAGTANVVVSGTNITSVHAARYSGNAAFNSSAQGGALSHSFSPAGAALMPFTMAFAGNGTPLAGTLERFDTGGDYYADRVVNAGGTFSVGCSAGDFPDSAAALFDAVVGSVDVTGAVTTSAASVTGAVATPKSLTAAVTTSSAAVAGALSTPKSVTGALTTASAAVTGSVATPKNLTAAVTTSSAAVTGAFAAILTGAVTTSSAAVAGSLQTPKSLSGALTTTPAAVTGSVATPHPVTAAVTTSSAAVTGGLSAAVNAAAAVTTSSAAVTGSVQTPHAVAGALTSTGPSVTGALATPHALSGAVTTASAAATGSVATPHSISGALTTTSPSITGSVSVVDEKDVSGALTTSSASVSAALATPHSLTAALTTSSAVVTGAMQVVVGVTAAVTTSSAAVTGAFNTPHAVTAAVTTSSAAVTGSVTLTDLAEVAGALTTSSPAVAGSLATPHAVTGALTTAPADVAGSVQPFWELTGALTTSASLVTGSVVLEAQVAAALETSAPSVLGDVQLPAEVTASLTTSAPTADFLIFRLLPGGIPGSATLELAATSNEISIARARALSTVVASEATIESKNNGTATI
jgi:hypothetical protein